MSRCGIARWMNERRERRGEQKGKIDPSAAIVANLPKA